MARRPFGHGPIAWFIKRALIATLLCATLLWAWLLLDRRTLPGLHVWGNPLPRTSEPEKVLADLATKRLATVVTIRTGPAETKATYSDLGVQLPVQELSARLLELGRSGNPLLDLMAFAQARSGGRDARWAPEIDRIALGRYIQAIRHNVERAPVAGASDGQGWSIAGVPGITLDTVSTVALVERLLRSGGNAVDVPLRQVPPPQSVAIGSPDAVLYDDEEEHEPADFAALAAGHYDAALAAAQPQAWQPSLGEQCDMDPPYQRFCQGPRRVALPAGPAAELAEQLDLGEVKTVSRLLRSGPKPEWVQAVGSQGGDSSLLWPVPGGRLWRGFGYVRREELKHKLHRGVDIGAPRGTPIVAGNDGIVAYSDNGVRGYGNLLVLVHADGSVTLHAHCRAIYLFAGQRVARGQIVGEVGDTGIARGSHLHFEYHVAGRPTDPADLFTRPQPLSGG